VIAEIIGKRVTLKNEFNFSIIPLKKALVSIFWCLPFSKIYFLFGWNSMAFCFNRYL